VTLRCVFLLTACLVLTVPARSGHRVSSQEQQVLKNWLARHSGYRQATDDEAMKRAFLEAKKIILREKTTPLRLHKA
jgi:hypothetical protein